MNLLSRQQPGSNPTVESPEPADPIQDKRAAIQAEMDAINTEINEIDRALRPRVAANELPGDRAEKARLGRRRADLAVRRATLGVELEVLERPAKAEAERRKVRVLQLRAFLPGWHTRLAQVKGKVTQQQRLVDLALGEQREIEARLAELEAELHILTASDGESKEVKGVRQ